MDRVGEITTVRSNSTVWKPTSVAPSAVIIGKLHVFADWISAMRKFTPGSISLPERD